MPTSTPFRLTYSELLNLSKKPYTSFFHAHLSAPSHPFHSPHPAHQFSHPAQTALQKSHTWKLIRAERQPRRGPLTKPIGPDCLPHQDGKSPFRELGSLSGALGTKKGNAYALPFLRQRYDINEKNANQERKNRTLSAWRHTSHRKCDHTCLGHTKPPDSRGKLRQHLTSCKTDVTNCRLSHA